MKKLPLSNLSLAVFVVAVLLVLPIIQTNFLVSSICLKNNYKEIERILLKRSSSQDPSPCMDCFITYFETYIGKIEVSIKYELDNQDELLSCDTKYHFIEKSYKAR
jgi:hypothetical protein